ncbi:hypothetical protein BCS42_16315 [Crenothrix sp. D3]|nr:hypothetical protein BCS42_16315 [Crenothrix sp. D3]
MPNYIYRLLTWGFLLLGLAGSGAAGYWMKVEIDTREYQRFIHYCEEIQQKITARLEAHEQILLGGAAGFDASDTVTRQEWHIYVEYLHRNNHFNGIQGLGFALWIPAKQLATHQAQIRAEGFPNYKIRPEGKREAYTSIIFLEPFTERNLHAFGYDMYAEPVRQAAMARARDENIVTLSGKVSLIQETDKNVQAGTLMYAPVYQKNKPIDTVEQRRAALFGWVYSPFRMTDLLNNILAAEPDTAIPHVYLHVYDGRNTQTEHLLYDNHPNPPSSDDSHHSVVELSNSFDDTVWTLQFEQRLNVDNLYYLNAWLVFGLGVLISLLGCLLLTSNLNTRANAVKIANQLTRELQESEQRFRLLADSAPVLIWLSDLDKLYYQFNKVWLDFTGRTLAQELGNGWLDGVYIDDLQHCVAIYSRSFDARLPFKMEYRLRRYDGEYCWLLDTGEPRFAEDGTFLGYIGSCVDIDERKQIENALAASEERFKTLFTHAPVGIAVIDSLTGYIYNANAKYAAIVGLTMDELQHIDWIKITHPDDVQASLNNLALMNAGKTNGFVIEKRYIHANGSIVWVNLTVAKLNLCEQGNPCHNSIVEDITERKQAELKIANSLSLLSATLESSSDAILVVDLNKNWVLYNQKFIDFWYIENDITTHNYDTSVSHYELNQLENADSFLHFLHEVQALSDTTEDSSFDIINFKEGKIVERYSIPQRINNDIVGRVWSFRDITQRTRAEQALQKESEKNLALLRNASDGVHILDVDGNLIELSDSFCHRLGYNRDEMLGMNVMQWDVYLYPSDCIKATKKLFKNPASTLFETSYRCKDGTIIDVEVNSIVLELDSKPVLFNSSRDITERKQIEEQLAVERARLAEVIKATNVGTWEWNVQTGATHFNERWAALLGYTLADIAPTSINTWLKLVHPNDLKRSNALLEQHFNGQTDYYVCESRMKHKQGHWVWILDQGCVSSWTSEGKPLLMSGTHQDITERKKMENELRKNRDELLGYFQQPFIGMVTVSHDQLTLNVNQRFCDMIGYTANEIQSINWEKFTHPDDLAPEQVYFEQAIRGCCNAYQMEKRYIHKDGHFVCVDLAVQCIRKRDGSLDYFIGMMLDITERKAAEEEIKQLAFYDPLTGLPNRRKLLDRLESAIALNHRANTKFAVFMMDLDKFKAVNDRLGHAAGDELLKQVAARVTTCLRKSDMVARLGGDEFVLVLENLKIPEAADIVALKVIADLALPFQLSETDSAQIGASIGISFYPQHGSTPESLMDHADTALYQAKDNGRGCFAYFSESE